MVWMRVLQVLCGRSSFWSGYLRFVVESDVMHYLQDGLIGRLNFSLISVASYQAPLCEEEDIVVRRSIPNELRREFGPCQHVYACSKARIIYLSIQHCVDANSLLLSKVVC